jgi:catechol 2,3-dioxygenase-like lactoylglutathione lyase family enzyme
MTTPATTTSTTTGAPSLPAQTRIGHVHLKVADLDRAVWFYHEVLGFDLLLNAGTAAILSAGGYHHHIGLKQYLPILRRYRCPRRGAGRGRLLCADRSADHTPPPLDASQRGAYSEATRQVLLAWGDWRIVGIDCRPDETVTTSGLV